MRLHQAITLCLVLSASTAAAGCVAVAAGAGAGYLISREVLANDVHSATVSLDVERVWAAAQETMRAKSTAPVSVENYPRVVKGVVEGADVSIEVQAYDIDRTVILVEAHKTLGPAGQVAERVLNALLDKLG